MSTNEFEDEETTRELAPETLAYVAEIYEQAFKRQQQEQSE